MVPVATVSTLVVAAAIAGLFVARSLNRHDVAAESPAPALRRIVHGGLRVEVPSGWARSGAAAIPGFRRPLGLRTAREEVRAAVELLPATSATLLPDALSPTSKAAAEPPDDVRLTSGQRAWRYRFRGKGGSVLVVIVAPTTAGVSSVACSSPVVAPIRRGCEVLASAVAVPGSQPLEPGPGAAFFSRLPGTVTELDAARTKSTRELSAAATATGQASAADEMARAHIAALTALAPLADERSRPQTAAVRALAATAAGYAALASAARTRAPHAYAAATRAVIGADADLRRAITKLAAAQSAATHTAALAANPPVRTPAARRSSRIHASFLLLALLGVFALSIVVREVLVVLAPRDV